MLRAQNQLKMGDESEEERARRLMRKRKQNTAITPVKSTARSIGMRERAAQLVKQRTVTSRNDHILTFCEVFESHLLSGTLSTYVRFTILLTLCCTWPTIPNHMPLLLTVMHTCCLSVQRLLRCMGGIHCEKYT